MLSAYAFNKWRKSSCCDRVPERDETIPAGHFSTGGIRSDEGYRYITHGPHQGPDEIRRLIAQSARGHGLSQQTRHSAESSIALCAGCLVDSRR
ncbi:MAG TPA: hypothetical protein ACQGQF_05100, partial [Xylella fastidiosa subsp. pauca]